MKKWIYKTLAVSVAFLTFGVITPSHEIWAAFDDGHDTKKTAIYESIATDVTDVYQLDELIEPEQHYLQSIMAEAKNQAYIKFGTKVSPVIENEFEDIIFPKMKEAMETTLASRNLKQIAITQKPSGDYNEKIFNLYDEETKKDVMRFHVRVENRPFDGHYYNFHYHVDEDRFATHYNLGEIYWSKNQPPKWLS